MPNSTKQETKPTETNMLPAEVHQLAGRLAEVVRDLTEAQRAAGEAAQAYQAAATSTGDTGGAWTRRESTAATVSRLTAQRQELETVLTARLRAALKPTAEGPKAARAADRAESTSATREAVELLQAAHGLLERARECFTVGGGHVRALAQEAGALARNLSERETFSGALPAHGPSLPPALEQARRTVEELLRIYKV